ncbi:ATP-binding cassette domain-containing protein [Posidoniimonas corsicana]|uniref:ATP-binding cassette domain-containing protein n=1 Tax=Posidoniimonas corsicana TaxID=1938618 RepID=UPI0011B6C54B|nr:ABC transporter ATP-binding protein [Posidoniimonas corsicana]
MPRVDTVVECPVHDSFRVQQAAGLFDVPLADRASERFTVDLPDLDEDWRIGLIVGPSGSGKTTVARRAYGDQLFESADWPADRAVVDAFAPLGVRDTVGLLTAVGFSSPPSWIKPYRVLSRGEQFRCDLARALAMAGGNSAGQQPRANSQLVVFDEFTSVVDRNVARVCSAAVAKAIRGGRVNKRFVAVTCHYDVARAG